MYDHRVITTAHPPYVKGGMNRCAFYLLEKWSWAFCIQMMPHPLGSSYTAVCFLGLDWPPLDTRKHFCYDWVEPFVQEQGQPSLRLSGEEQHVSRDVTFGSRLLCDHVLCKHLVTLLWMPSVRQGRSSYRPTPSPLNVFELSCMCVALRWTGCRSLQRMLNFSSVFFFFFPCSISVRVCVDACVYTPYAVYTVYICGHVTLCCSCDAKKHKDCASYLLVRSTGGGDILSCLFQFQPEEMMFYFLSSGRSI